MVSAQRMCMYGSSWLFTFVFQITTHNFAIYIHTYQLNLHAYFVDISIDYWLKCTVKSRKQYLIELSSFLFHIFKCYFAESHESRIKMKLSKGWQNRRTIIINKMQIIFWRFMHSKRQEQWQWSARVRRNCLLTYIFACAA